MFGFVIKWPDLTVVFSGMTIVPLLFRMMFDRFMARDWLAELGARTPAGRREA